MENYSAPSAGSDGNYGAPTPHAAVAAHQPYTAPSSDMPSSGGASGGAGLDAVDSVPSWSPTPGESMEMSERYDV